MFNDNNNNIQNFESIERIKNQGEVSAEQRAEQLAKAAKWDNAMSGMQFGADAETNTTEDAETATEADPVEVAELTAQQEQEKPKSHEEDVLEDIMTNDLLTQSILEKANSLTGTSPNAAQEVFTTLTNQTGVNIDAIASSADRLIEKIPSTVTNIGDTDGTEDPTVRNKNEAASQLATILSYAQTISGIAKLYQGDIDGAEDRATKAAETAESSITDTKVNPDNDAQDNKDAAYIAGSALESANALQRNIAQVREMQEKNESTNQTTDFYAQNNGNAEPSAYYATPVATNYQNRYIPQQQASKSAFYPQTQESNHFAPQQISPMPSYPSPEQGQAMPKSAESINDNAVYAYSQSSDILANNIAEEYPQGTTYENQSITDEAQGTTNESLDTTNESQFNSIANQSEPQNETPANTATDVFGVRTPSVKSKPNNENTSGDTINFSPDKSYYQEETSNNTQYSRPQ